MKDDEYALHNRARWIRVLHRLEGGEGIGKKEGFMWRGKERKMREAGIDDK